MHGKESISTTETQAYTKQNSNKTQTYVSIIINYGDTIIPIVNHAPHLNGAHFGQVCNRHKSHKEWPSLSVVISMTDVA